MRLFLPIFVGVCVSACVTMGKRKTTSGWYVLEKAAEVKCGHWPLREKDLQMDELALVQSTQRGPAPGFLVSGLKRDASPMHYYVPFNGDLEVDPEGFADLSLGRGAVVVGGETTGGKVAANVIHNTADKASLEVRTVQDNVVKYKGDLGSFNVVEGSTVPSQGGSWIVFKTEDNIWRLAFLDLRQKDKPVSRVITAATFKDRPFVLTALSKSGALLVWKDGESGKPFHAQSVGEDGVLGQAVTLEIPVSAQVESWAATLYGGGYYVAAVDGDSLIGQADLKISYFNWADGSASVKWTKAQALKDVHVTEPVFMASGKGLEVLLLNWIDEESTIARYMVAGGSIGKPVFSGIFVKGTRIVDAFTGGSPDDLYVITRHRDDTRWAFQLCEI